MGMLDDDLAAVLADQVAITGQGVVVWRGKTINAALDEFDAVQTDPGTGEERPDGGRFLFVATRDIPAGGGFGDTITVDRSAYQVRLPFKMDEGRVTRFIIVEVTA